MANLVATKVIVQREGDNLAVYVVDEYDNIRLAYETPCEEIEYRLRHGSVRADLNEIRIDVHN